MGNTEEIYRCSREISSPRNVPLDSPQFSRDSVRAKLKHACTTLWWMTPFIGYGEIAISVVQYVLLNKSEVPRGETFNVYDVKENDIAAKLICICIIYI